MDLHSNIKFSQAFGPVAAIADNTPYVSAILDTANFETNGVVIKSGVLGDAGAEFTALLEEGDAANLSDAAAVADADLIGTEAGASFIQSDDNACKKLGYKGRKRYIRLTLTPANNAASAFFDATWYQANARKAPLS